MIPFLSPVPLWTYIYKDLFSEHDFNISTFGTIFVMVFFFWIWAVPFMYVDLTGTPDWMKKYKVQPGTNTPVDKARLWSAFVGVWVNDVVIGLPFVILLFPLQQYMGCSCKPEDIPSIFTVIRDILGIFVANEVWFYYTHRVFHWGPLYRRIHKQHHEWRSPVGLVATYAHPIEHIVCNLPSYYLGPLVMSSHLITLWGWFIFSQYTTVFHHSGYALPHMPCPMYHDHHHLKLNGNYAAGYLDRFHGTDLGIGKKPNSSS